MLTVPSVFSRQAPALPVGPVRACTRYLVGRAILGTLLSPEHYLFSARLGQRGGPRSREDSCSRCWLGPPVNRDLVSLRSLDGRARSTSLTAIGMRTHMFRGVGTLRVSRSLALCTRSCASASRRLSAFRAVLDLHLCGLVFFGDPHLYARCFFSPVPRARAPSLTLASDVCASSEIRSPA